jgi:hypothetical protein
MGLAGRDLAYLPIYGQQLSNCTESAMVKEKLLDIINAASLEYKRLLPSTNVAFHYRINRILAAQS